MTDELKALRAENDRLKEDLREARIIETTDREQGFYWFDKANAAQSENARLQAELAPLKAFWEWSRLADKELFQIDYEIAKNKGE